MRLVILTHPQFLPSESMPRFAQMISQGMHARGHSTTEWTAKPFFYKLPVPSKLKKWLGYIDQFIVFPLQVRRRLRQLAPDTLFVFSDQALGPWVPLVAHRPHVIHVHDFMALRSSLGEVVQNPTGWSGRQYQALIQRGFGQGHAFISVSEKTRADLHRFLPRKPSASEVVYNGLNFPFRRMTKPEYSAALAAAGLAVPASGFLLHVGGNQWYKNRLGVLEVYAAYARQTQNPLPLWMVGARATAAMTALAQSVVGKGKVQFLSGFTDDQVCAAYSAARLMIFPSFAEGFGWPIAEAMACGCPVLTTDEAPMTEVGGEAAFYIPRRPDSAAGDGADDWAAKAAKRVAEILALPADVGQLRQTQGFKQAAQFDPQRTMTAYEKIYQHLVSTEKAAA